MLCRIKSAAVAIVSPREPAARIIGAMAIEDDGLYFLSAAAKRFAAIAAPVAYCDLWYGREFRLGACVGYLTPCGNIGPSITQGGMVILSVEAPPDIEGYWTWQWQKGREAIPAWAHVRADIRDLGDTSDSFGLRFVDIHLDAA